MKDEQKKTYVSWLRDAHAMELGLVTMLEKQIAETADKPAIQTRLKQHLEETKRHAELVEECLKRNGSDASGGKDLISKMSAAGQGMLASLPEDSLVKNAMGSYAAEHFEIASYTAIQAAAEECGDDETSSACSTIMEDEIRMANWLAEQLPSVVKEHIATL
jgi:ferritin-like metal-binding protein YciE